MPSIYRDTYVPILLTRQAEIRSLGDLSSKIANSIVPMFMVHPRAGTTTTMTISVPSTIILTGSSRICRLAGVTERPLSTSAT